MACEAALPFERFLTAVALEWLFPSVLPHVLLQHSKYSASIFALVTFERLFSSVLLYHVNFQMIICNAQIIACCASPWLFCGVCHLVRLQVV